MLSNDLFNENSKINRYSRNVKEFDYTHFIEKLTDKNFVLKCYVYFFNNPVLMTLM